MTTAKARTQERSCIYCGLPVVKVRKGDHIIPEALGGKLTLKSVCHSCNGTFSRLENELIGNTPLAILAARELGRSMSNSMKLYPQLVFDDARLSIRFDSQEGLDYGVDRFCHLFPRRVKQALDKTVHHQKGGFIYARVPSPTDAPGGFRYPPRLFVRGSMEDAARSKSIELGYTHAADRKRVLREISRWSAIPRFEGGSTRLGTFEPVVRTRFNRADVVRSLWKIAFNLLAHIASRTPVNCNSFSQLTDAVRGITAPAMAWLDHNGFVAAECCADLASTSSSHRVEVSWFDDKWRFRFAFFGGDLCAVVFFDGPNYEEWNTAEVTIPIRSRDWVIVKTPIFLPHGRIPIEWGDLGRIVPSETFINSQILI
jgi:hypothetical protein